MTNEQLVYAIQRGENVNQCMSDLYSQNIGFLQRQVNPFTIYADRDDLLQECFFALYTAAIKYDAEKDARFLSYAEYWTRQVILRYLDNLGAVVRVPVYRRQQVYKYRSIIATLEAAGQPITDAELCRLLEVSPPVLEAVRAADDVLKVQSYDVQLYEDGEITRLDMIADPVDHTAEILDRVERCQLRTTIEKCLDDLPDTEQRVIHAYFFEGVTLAALGAEMHKDTTSIHRIKKRALTRLRETHSAELKPYYDNVVALKIVKEPKPEPGCAAWWKDPAIMAMRQTDRRAWLHYMVDHFDDFAPLKAVSS